MHVFILEAPITTLYEPRGHGVHVDKPIEDAKNPAGHKEHVVAPDVAMLPGAHATHDASDAAPTNPDAVPAGQSKHELEP